MPSLGTRKILRTPSSSAFRLATILMMPELFWNPSSYSMTNVHRISPPDMSASEGSGSGRQKLSAQFSEPALQTTCKINEMNRQVPTCIPHCVLEVSPRVGYKLKSNVFAAGFDAWLSKGGLGVLCPDLTQCGWASTMRLK